MLRFNLEFRSRTKSRRGSDATGVNVDSIVVSISRRGLLFAFKSCAVFASVCLEIREYPLQ